MDIILNGCSDEAECVDVPRIFDRVEVVRTRVLGTRHDRGNALSAVVKVLALHALVADTKDVRPAAITDDAEVFRSAAFDLGGIECVLVAGSRDREERMLGVVSLTNLGVVQTVHTQVEVCAIQAFVAYTRDGPVAAIAHDVRVHSALVRYRTAAG